MTFKIKRTAGQGIEFEIASHAHTRYHDAGWGWPARVYRYLARKTIEELLEENRRLRMGVAKTLPMGVVLVRHPAWLRASAAALRKLGPERPGR